MRLPSWRACSSCRTEDRSRTRRCQCRPPPGRRRAPAETRASAGRQRRLSPISTAAMTAPNSSTSPLAGSQAAIGRLHGQPKRAHEWGDKQDRGQQGDPVQRFRLRRGERASWAAIDPGHSVLNTGNRLRRRNCWLFIGADAIGAGRLRRLEAFDGGEDLGFADAQAGERDGVRERSRRRAFKCASARCARSSRARWRPASARPNSITRWP